MFNALIFYNHFGAGDLFESRQFIKKMMNTIEAKSYIYSHNKHKDMFSDIKNLEYMPTTSVTDPTKTHILSNNDLYINTWIGRNSKYVIPIIGCTVHKNFEMFNDTLALAGQERLPGRFIDYLPTIDFSTMDNKAVNKFVRKHKSKKIILVCNGTVYSKQAENFNLVPCIEDIANKHKDCMIVTTEQSGVQNKNVVCVNDIVVKDFNLNDIAYLATFADTIIGRKSGPAVFAHTKDVWYSNKKSLSFTYTRTASHFVLEDNLPLRKYWSPAIDFESVTQIMNEVINE